MFRLNFLCHRSVCFRMSVTVGAVLATLLLLARAAHADAPTTGDIKAYPFTFTTLHNQGVPLVSLLLDGNIPATFTIDTGSEVSMISSALVDELHLRRTESWAGLGGEQLNYVKAGSVQLGSLTVTGVPFLVRTDAAIFGPSEQKIDGVLGGDFLSNFKLYLDFPHGIGALMSGKLEDGDLPALGMANATVMQMHSVPGVRTDNLEDHDIPDQVEYGVDVAYTGNGGTQSDRLLIDTGDQLTIANAGTYSKLKVLVTEIRPTPTLGMEFTILQRGEIASLQVGSITLPNFELSAPVTQRDFFPPLLGEDVLSSCVMLLDYAGSKLYLKPIEPPTATVSLDPQQIDVQALRNVCRTNLYPPASLAGDGQYDISGPDGLAASLNATAKGDVTDDYNDLKIGDAYRAVGRESDAQHYYQLALTPLKSFTAENPSDIVAEAALIEALTDVGSLDVAEATARQWTAASPKTPEAWGALGSVLHAKSLFTLTGQAYLITPSLDLPDVAADVAHVRALPNAGDINKQSSDEADEASKCFDKMISLPPQTADAFQRRAAFTESDFVGRFFVWSLSQGQINVDSKGVSNYFADLDQAAKLAPTDAKSLLSDTIGNYNANAISDPDTMKSAAGPDLKTLSKSVQRTIHSNIDALTAISKNPSPDISGPALSALGVIDFVVMHDGNGAEQTLLSALKTDPSCGDAAINLAVLLSNQGRYSDLAADLESVVAAKDNACARLLLARTYAHMYQPQQALENAEAAVKLKPDSAIANLIAAETELADGDPTLLQSASDSLAKVGKAVGPTSDGDLCREYQTTQCVYEAVSGHPSDASSLALTIFARYPYCSEVKAIIAAMYAPASTAQVPGN